MLKIICLSFMFAAQISWAAEEAPGVNTTGIESNRMSNRLGATLGVIGAPYPSIFGVNANYNVTDYLRANLGYGQIEATTGVSINGNSVSSQSTKVTTVGAGLDGMVPGWNVTPVAGIHASNISSEGDGKLTIQGVEGTGSLVYATLGVDWQTSGGFNASVGYNVPVSGKGSGATYASLGWYFDIL